jgi:hypothetical protein
MRPDRRLRVCLIAALLVAAGSTARAQTLPAAGVIVPPSPMYLVPDATRVPLTTLPSGTPVRVLVREGEWYRVVFRDRYLGDRTGYVLASNVRIEPATAGPAAAPPGVPGQIAPGGATAQQPVIISETPMIARRDHGYLSFNGTYQRDSTAFSTATTFVQGGRTGTITTNYGGVHLTTLDVGGGQRIWSILSVGAAATWSSQITDAAVTATIPRTSPAGSTFTVSGVAPEIRRQELGVHVVVSVGVPRHHRVQVAAFAGPSWFFVKQGLVTAVTANEATATFGAATVVESRENKLGANGGVDASVLLWKSFGIGGIVRYSRANVLFKPAPGMDITVHPGGLQLGGGIRFRF